MNKILLLFSLIGLFFFAGCGNIATLSITSLDLEYLNNTNNTIYYNGSVDITGSYLVNGSVLQINGNGSSLRGDCSNQQVLKWNGTEWICGFDIIGSGGGGSNASLINSVINYDSNNNIASIFDTYDIYTVNSSFNYDNNSIVQNATIINSGVGTTNIQYIYNSSGSLIEVIYT